MGKFGRREAHGFAGKAWGLFLWGLTKRSGAGVSKKEAVGLGTKMEVAVPIPVTSSLFQTARTASQNSQFLIKDLLNLDTLIFPSDSSVEITP